MRTFAAALLVPFALVAQSAPDPAAVQEWKTKHAKALATYEAAHAKRRAGMEKQLNSINTTEDAYRTLMRDELGANDNMYIDPTYRERMKFERYHLFQMDDSSALQHIEDRRANDPDKALASFARRQVIIVAVLVDTDSAVKDATAQLRYARLAYDKLKSVDNANLSPAQRSKFRVILDYRDKYVKFSRLRQEFHEDHAKALRQEQGELEKQFAAVKAVSSTP